MQCRPLVVLTLLVGLGACAAPGKTPVAMGPEAAGQGLLYAGFGNYEREISTEDPAAQRFFDQGLQLLYGFNHDEAIRSFQRAAELDPKAAMPWWGIAFANGINLNDPAMSDQRSKDARAAADQAMARLQGASALEVAMVRAVSERYEYPAPEDRRALDEAYAAAMGKAHRSFPKDADLAALYADSLMNLQPWDYWNEDGSPKGRIEEITSTLEAVMAEHPDHPGANHFYIHAVEASADPDRAVPAADRLIHLVPGSGHLVHMPSHIYVRVGRYSDAVDTNAQAVKVDRNYFALAPEPAMYAVYYAHNLHFLAYAAMMSGRFEEALEAARNLERDMPEANLRAFAGLIEGIMPSTLHVLVRFGKWEMILDEPEYPEFRLVSRAVRHYARSIAHSALGDTASARQELAAFEEAVALIPAEWFIFNNPVERVLPIARAMLRGELLYREGRFEEAFALLREGAAAEDALIYDEPPGWMLPVRHALGALLMGQGHFSQAEAVYREDLERNRGNGWGLLGLQKSLAAQGQKAQAAALDAELARAWSGTELRPNSSCYCEPGT